MVVYIRTSHNPKTNVTVNPGVVTKSFAFSQYVTYWTGPFNQLAHSVLEITFFFVPPILLNFLNVCWYGELEFVLTTVKVQVILMLIVVGLVIAAGGGP